MKHVLPWIAAHDGEPYFLWIHLMDPHDPYTPPDRERGKTPFDPDYDGPFVGDEIQRLYIGELPMPEPRDLEHLYALYHDEIRFADQQIERFWSALPDDAKRRATFIFSSDHGEEIGDHGGWKHGPALWEEVIRVPLAIRAGEGRPLPQARADELVSLLDLVPTILDLAGLPARVTADGSSLVGTARSRRALPPVTILTQGPIRATVVRPDSKLVYFDVLSEAMYPDRDKDPDGWKMARRLPGLLPALGRYDLVNDPGEKTLLPIDPGTFGDDWRSIELAIAHTRMGLEFRLIAYDEGPERTIAVEGLPAGAIVEPFGLEADDRVSLERTRLVLTTRTAGGDVDGFIVRGTFDPAGITIAGPDTDSCTELVTTRRITLASGGTVVLDAADVTTSVPRLETSNGHCAGLYVWKSAGRVQQREPEEVDEERKKLRSLGYVH
jgi:hypothetical protein